MQAPAYRTMNFISKLDSFLIWENPNEIPKHSSERQSELS
jgi:hypothetical protein